MNRACVNPVVFDFRRLFSPLGLLSVVLLVGMGSFSVHGEASDKRASREREALRRVQQQLVQVQGQISALEQEKAKLAADKDASQAAAQAESEKAAKLQRGLNANTQQLLALSSELTRAKEALATTALQLSETRTTLDQTAELLREAEREKRNLDDVRQAKEREIASCEEKNVALYGIGRSLMARFEHKTCGEILAQKEPFTGLKHVETENLLEEYRDKLDDQKLIKAPGS